MLAKQLYLGRERQEYGKCGSTCCHMTVCAGIVTIQHPLPCQSGKFAQDTLWQQGRRAASYITVSASLKQQHRGL